MSAARHTIGECMIISSTAGCFRPTHLKRAQPCTLKPVQKHACTTLTLNRATTTTAGPGAIAAMLHLLHAYGHHDDQACRDTAATCTAVHNHQQHSNARVYGQQRTRPAILTISATQHMACLVHDDTVRLKWNTLLRLHHSNIRCWHHPIQSTLLPTTPAYCQKATPHKSFLVSSPTCNSNPVQQYDTSTAAAVHNAPGNCWHLCMVTECCTPCTTNCMLCKRASPFLSFITRHKLPASAVVAQV